jgi:hypothetical protein
MIRLIGLEADISNKSKQVLAMNLDHEKTALGICSASMFPVVARLGTYLYDQRIQPSLGLPLITTSFGNVMASVCQSSWFNDESAEAMIEKLPQNLAMALTDSFNLLKRDGRF